MSLLCSGQNLTRCDLQGAAVTDEMPNADTLEACYNKLR